MIERLREHRHADERRVGVLMFGSFPSLASGVLLDRSGELSRCANALVGEPPPRGGAPLVKGLVLNLINLVLFGANLLNRGEFARAWALLIRMSAI